jgi:hypothetical protein
MQISTPHPPYQPYIYLPLPLSPNRYNSSASKQMADVGTHQTREFPKTLMSRILCYNLSQKIRANDQGLLNTEYPNQIL